jgi:hypothetical protein
VIALTRVLVSGDGISRENMIRVMMKLARIVY